MISDVRRTLVLAAINSAGKIQTSPPTDTRIIKTPNSSTTAETYFQNAFTAPSRIPDVSQDIVDEVGFIVADDFEQSQHFGGTEFPRESAERFFQELLSSELLFRGPGVPETAANCRN
jgi:hypothetical protein